MRAAARRRVRFLLDVGTPFVWLFALLGAALIGWPAYGFPTAADGPPRPAGRVKVDVTAGPFLLRDPNGAAHPAGRWHPRMLAVETLGEPLPESWTNLFTAGEEVDAETAALATAYLDDQPWYLSTFEPPRRFPRLGFVTGKTATGAHRFAGTFDPYEDWGDGSPASEQAGPPHRVRGIGISLWPLLALAGLLAAGRWALTARRRELAGNAPDEAPGLPRRLVRVWALGLAAAGFGAVVVQNLPFGPWKIQAYVARGPADAPHPRVWTLWMWRETPPAPPGGGEPAETERRFAAPVPGLWGARTRGNGWANAELTVSLWWFAAACLTANGVTLWRRRGERRRIAA